MFYLTDPKTGEKSATLTVYYTGSFLLIFKLLTSGMKFGSLDLGLFSGSDFALALSALGAVYKAKLFAPNPNTKEPPTNG